MKKNNKGFTLVEILFVTLVIAVIGFIGYYVWNSQQSKKSTNSQDAPSVSNTEQSNETTSQEEKPEVLDWERIESGKKAFSVQIPDGWGDFYKPLDSDLLIVMGENQPKLSDGNAVVVKELPSFGADGSSVLSMLIYDNFAEPRGTASDFSIGDLKGKKYVYTAEKTVEGEFDGETKGDKKYEYRFELGGGKQLAVFYNVYVATDSNDQIETVDKIVKSIEFK